MARTDGRAFFVACVILCAVGVTLRTVMYVELRATPFFSALFSDSRMYISFASLIREGAVPPTPYFLTPVYPYILASLSLLGADPLVAVRLIQIAFGGCSIVLAAVIARMHAGNRAGILAGTVTALSPVLIWYDNGILIESLLTLVVAAHALMFLRAYRNPGMARFAAAGIAMGVLLSLRFSIAAAWLGLVGMLLLDGRNTPAFRRGAAVYTAAALLAVSPWIIRNAVVAHAFVPVTSSGGFNLYAGNNAESDGRYAVPEKIDVAADPNGMKYAERTLGRQMSAGDVSSYWFDKAWSWMSSHPESAVMLYFRKLALFFSPAEIEQIGISARFFATEYGGIPALPLPGFFVVAMLALLGVLLTAKRNSGLRPLSVFIAAFVLSTAVFFVNGRLRAPLLPLLGVLAGIGIDAAISLLHDRAFRRLGVSLGLVAACSVVLVLQPHIEQRFDSEYNRLGQIAFDTGAFGEAEQYFTRSIAERPTAIAMTNKGNALAVQRRYDEAAALYDSALAREPRNMLAWFNAGNLAVQRGAEGAALVAWDRAVRIDPNFAPGWRNIGLLQVRRGNMAQGIAGLERYLRCETDPARRAAMEKQLASIKAAALSGVTPTEDRTSRR